MSQADLSGTTSTAPSAPVTGTDVSTTSVRGAIARAAAATGVDFSYLLAQAKLESSLDPQARSAGSSAAGLYQFTRGTWSSMLARHGGALAGNTASLPSSPAQQMSLRFDPGASAMMAAKLAGDNTAALTTTLGRAPTSAELYLAHFLGSAGATRFLSALATDPAQSAAALLPKAAASNQAVFFDAGGAPRSLGGVMALIQTRMDAALQGRSAGRQDFGAVDAGDYGTTIDPGGLSGPALTTDDLTPTGGPIAQQFTQAQAAGGDTLQTAGTDGTTSMADTLRNTFGLSGENAGSGDAPAFVRSAYGRLQALGL